MRRSCARARAHPLTSSHPTHPPHTRTHLEVLERDDGVVQLWRKRGVGRVERGAAKQRALGGVRVWRVRACTRVCNGRR